MSLKESLENKHFPPLFFGGMTGWVDGLFGFLALNYHEPKLLAPTILITVSSALVVWFESHPESMNPRT